MDTIEAAYRSEREMTVGRFSSASPAQEWRRGQGRGGGGASTTGAARPRADLLTAVSALLFAASAAVTVVWCAWMSSMGGDMAMPGGWTMSMAWMRMPGQTWPGAAASFMAMWLVMMVAMMMPSLLPMLRRYREAVGSAGAARIVPLTAVAGGAYFLVWTLCGAVVFPLGVALAMLEMQHPALARAVPMGVALVVLVAGALQFTRWKARHLACCRKSPGPGRALAADVRTAWRHGLRLGVHCGICCVGPMAVLLVLGVMDLAAMVLVGVAITLERRAPGDDRAARVAGVVAMASGLLMTLRAVGAVLL